MRSAALFAALLLGGYASQLELAIDPVVQTSM